MTGDLFGMTPPTSLDGLGSYGSVAQYYTAGFGNIPRTAGDNTLEFRAVGKNHSSSGCWLVSDRLELRRVG